jgi:hypothetical protein
MVRAVCVFPVRMRWSHFSAITILLDINPDDSNSGQSSSVWTPYKKDGTGDISALYIDVDASKSKFHGVPAYVSCVAGDSHHWGVTGAASMYSPTRTGFRVYLDKALSADFAHRKKWHVNYIAYQGKLHTQHTRSFWPLD